MKKKAAVKNLDEALRIIKGYRLEIDSMKNEREELQGFITARNNRINELTNELQAKAKRIIQLETRLDAALYAMVVFQGIIKNQDSEDAKRDPEVYFKFLKECGWIKDEVALAR